MKKIVLYTTITLLLISAIAGGTYAYMVATINSATNAVNTAGANLNVIYTGGTSIEGLISMSEDKSGGLNTTVNIKVSEESVVAKVNLYISVNQITPALATEGFKWEVYKNVNGTVSFVDSGTFVDCQSGETTKKCTNGDKLYIVNNYQLLTDNTAFTVYVWLNGDEVGNEVMGATFKGTIIAESENFTANLG